MGKAKNIKTLIIILAIVLVLICATFAILYFATDTFKSNKKSFNNYLSQVNLDSFIKIKDISNYEERLLNEAHTSDGKISIVLKEDDEDLVNEELDFTASNDLKNKYANAKIDLKQDEEKKLTMDFLKDDNLYGLKFEDIVNQYITLDSNNSKELMEKLNITSIDKISDILGELDYSMEDIEEILKELKQIFSKYVKISMSEIPEENFSKIKKEQILVVDNKKVEVDGYNVTIKGEELIRIIKTCIKTAKNDEQIYTLMNKLKIFDIASFTEYQDLMEQMELMFDEIQEELLLDLNISLYKQGKDLVKVYVKVKNSEGNSNSYIGFSIENNRSIELNVILDRDSLYDEESTISSYSSYITNGEYSFSIEKDTTSGQEIGYKISVEVKQNEEEVFNANLLLSKYGKADSQNVKTEAVLNVASDNVNLSISYNNNVSFGEIEKEQEFVEGGYGIINEYSEEQLGNLIRNLTNRIFEKVDKKKSIIGSFLLMNEELNQSISEAAENASSAAANIFNNMFSMYEGVQSGTTVKMLISTIEASNQSQTEHIIEYNEIEVDDSRTYNVTFEKDSEGYINKANIE